MESRESCIFQLDFPCSKSRNAQNSSYKPSHLAWEKCFTMLPIHASINTNMAARHWSISADCLTKGRHWSQVRDHWRGEAHTDPNPDFCETIHKRHWTPCGGADISKCLVSTVIEQSQKASFKERNTDENYLWNLIECFWSGWGRLLCPVAGIKCLQLIFLQTTDTFTSNKSRHTAAKRVKPHSHCMFAKWLEYPGMEGMVELQLHFNICKCDTTGFF